MPWQETFDKNCKKTLGELATHIRAGGYLPIILRFKRSLKTSFDMPGFEGAAVTQNELADGTIDMSVDIVQGHRATFWRDAFNIGYCLLPNTELNVRKLTGMEAYNPGELWIIEEPMDVKQQILEAAKSIRAAAAIADPVKKPVEKKPEQAKLDGSNVPENSGHDLGRVKKGKKPAEPAKTMETVEDILNAPGVPA